MMPILIYLVMEITNSTSSYSIMEKNLDQIKDSMREESIWTLTLLFHVFFPETPIQRLINN